MFYADTTPCYPYAETDPFIISVDELPDIFFAGNQVSGLQCKQNVTRNILQYLF